MGASGTSNSLFDYVLDVGRDDYYGHSGSWWDVQDSAWLSHLNAPQFALTVAHTGDGKVTSDLPGIACPPACSIPWDSGTKVTLTAEAGRRARFAGWTRRLLGRDAATVTMDAAKSVCARFVEQATMHVVRRAPGPCRAAPRGSTARAACRVPVRRRQLGRPDGETGEGVTRCLVVVPSCGTRPTCSVASPPGTRPSRDVRPGDDAPGRVGLRRRPRHERAGRDLVPDAVRSRVPGDDDGATTAGAVEGLAIHGLDRGVPRQGRLRGQGRRSPRHLREV